MNSKGNLIFDPTYFVSLNFFESKYFFLNATKSRTTISQDVQT